MKLGWTQEEAFHVDMLLGEYGHACEVREKYLARIERTVAGNMEMTKVMQVLGVRFVVAFVLIAFIEEIQRFPGSTPESATPAKRKVSVKSATSGEAI